MRISTSKNGYISMIKTNRGKMVNTIRVKHSVFRYNKVWKTYNSISNNELLHSSSVVIEDIIKQVQDYENK